VVFPTSHWFSPWPDSGKRNCWRPTAQFHQFSISHRHQSRPRMLAARATVSNLACAAPSSMGRSPPAVRLTSAFVPHLESSRDQAPRHSGGRTTRIAGLMSLMVGKHSRLTPGSQQLYLPGGHLRFSGRCPACRDNGREFAAGA